MQSDLILCDPEKSSASNFKSENHSSITYSNIQSNKTIIEGADTKIISDEQKRTEKENMELEKTRVLSEPEKSLTSNLKSGSTTINSNIQSDVFRDREKKRLRMEGTGFSTDQENRSDRLCNSKREIKPGNTRNPLKCTNMFNPIASVIENIKETGVEKQLNSDIRISNPKTLSGSHKQDLPSRLGGKDSTNIVKIRNASNSIARTIYSDKNQPKEKKIVRSESFCFLDIEDGSHHQNKATKAVMKGSPLYFPKRFPSLVKSKICSDKKKQKKQLSSRSTKYSSDKESSSKRRGRELERVVKIPICSCESRGSLNKTNNKGRSEKYKGIKMKKIRSESAQSSLVNEINPKFREGRLEGKLKDRIFRCEGGDALSKTDNKTDMAKSDNREENEEERIRLESRYIPFIPESRSNSLKEKPDSKLTNSPSKCPTGNISNGLESKTKKSKRKSWSVVNVKSSSGKEVLKIFPSLRKDTGNNKSSCVREEAQKYLLSPMPSLSSNPNQDLDSTNIVKIRNASNSIARTIHRDKDQPKEKKIIRSESFCFLDIEDGSHHQNKATKAAMKGPPMDFIAKRVPTLVKSKVCSDTKKRKKQLSSKSTKYSSDKESSSKHRGRELEHVVKDPIFSCESGGSLNKTNNKARSEKYKGIKMKKIRSESAQSSLVNEINPKFREGRLEGKLKDPIFRCESGDKIQPKEKKIIRSESFCFLDIEDGSHHQNKATKAAMKGPPLDFIAKRVPTLVKSKVCSDTKKRKKQLSSRSTKYSSDKESSSKHRGRELDHVVKDPIFSCESGGSLNKTNNKARSEKYKGIKMKKIRSESAQSSLVNEINPKFREGRLEGKLKDPIFRCESGDKIQPKEKKIIRSESFCFLDIEDGSHHQNKATKAAMKGPPLDFIAKRVPTLVKSKVCSDTKKRKKQLSSRSTKYSSDKESSSKHRGWELEHVVKNPIFSCESGGSLNKTNNKARSEKYKGIKMKKIRSESAQSSLVNEINPKFREGRLEGKLKDPIFRCESGDALSKTDNKTDMAKSDNREENEEKRIRLESRYIPFIPESRSNSLKEKPDSKLTNSPSKCPTGNISNGLESKTKKSKRKSWSVVNVKSSSGKEVQKIVLSLRKDTANNKSSCVRDEAHKYLLSPMPSLSSNPNQDLDIQKTGSDISHARFKFTSLCNDYSVAALQREEDNGDDFFTLGDVQSPDCNSLRNLRTERSESKGENDAALSDFETSKNDEPMNLPAKINSLRPHSNLKPDEPSRRDLYSPISEASSPQPSSTSLVDTTFMEQLFLKRSKLVEVIVQLKEKRLKIEEKIKASFESLERVKASKKKISKYLNDMRVAKQSNKLLEKDFKEVKKKAEGIRIEMESLSDADLIKRNSFFNRLQELQKLDSRLQEIKKEIENHQTSVLLPVSVSFQEVLIAEQMKFQNLQEKCSHLEVQRDEIKVRQENLEKQLEENKMELDKELLKQKKICSVLEKDISVAYTAEVTSPCYPRVESLFKNEETPSPDSQPTFTEACLSTLSSSSFETICSTLQMENQRECQNIKETHSTRRVESPENQLQQPSPDSRMSPSNVVSELNNLCSSGGLVKNEVISRPYVNPDAREGPMNNKTVLKLKDVKKESLFPRETKLAFKRLVSLVLRAEPEKPENIVLQKEFVVSLISMDAWPELYSQVQRTNVLYQEIPYSVFIEDLEKIQASNNPLPDSSTSVSPEATLENNNHLALHNAELAFSNSTQSLPEQASSNHLSNASNNVSGPNLSEMQHEYHRNYYQRHYNQQQNRQGFHQPNYTNNNLMFQQDSSNNPLPDSCTSVSPEATSENNNNFALHNTELFFSNSTQSLPEQASSNHLSNASSNSSGPNLSEMRYEYHRNCHQKHYIRQQNRQGFYQPNYTNGNHMLVNWLQDSSVSQNWQQNIYPSQLLDSSINNSSCLPNRSYAQAGNLNLNLHSDQGTPHFPPRSQTQARNQRMNKKMQPTVRHWHQNAFSTNLRPQYVQNHAMTRPSFLVPEPLIQNRNIDVILQGLTGVCVVCGRQAVIFCSICHLVAHLYCSEACQTQFYLPC
ncbi:uncharacterized protein LOC136028041 isoform X2 [Artemia franciscana]|uniref:uncharacterized protein LOC136028041 isoform X2 n=1 Tax=Artemia franciscana TaxID=6661 RepID=UPI0032D9E70F